LRPAGDFIFESNILLRPFDANLFLSKKKQKQKQAAWRETVDSVGRLAESLYSFPARSKGTAPAADQEQGLYSGNEGSAPESIVI